MEEDQTSIRLLADAGKADKQTDDKDLKVPPVFTVFS